MDNLLSLYCRLCAEIKSNTDLIDTVNNDLDLKCKIYDLLAIEISNDIDLPKSICNECFNKIILCSEFKEQSQKAQTILREIVILNNKVKLELSAIEENIEQEDNNYNDSRDDPLSADENPNSIGDDPKEDITIVKNEIKIEDAEINNKQCKSSKDNRSDEVKKLQQRWSNDVYKYYGDWQCNDCDEIIKSLKHFREHCAAAHNKLPVYVCKICSRVYQNEKFRAFYKHISRHFKYQQRPDSSKVKKEHKCTECGKLFEKPLYLQRHSKAHKPKDLFTCTTCNKQYQKIEALKYHEAKHTEERVLVYCEQCGQSFTTKSNLECHMKTVHSQERPYRCEQCPKRFKNMKTLNDHLKTHLGLRLKCNNCDKLFSCKASLKRHSSIHSGLLPFECSFCNKRFRIAETLKIHVRQHTGERPFSCEKCNHHFSDLSNYIKHMRGKHGVLSVAKDPVYCNPKYVKTITESQQPITEK
ncbi:zinc finger protein 391-like [Chrysoperla carnea]|uniref:zinc finger protein 391-like n=1 Tax=Chrysoperla carnea TaxID=189513 RepID=UPI001D067C6C|nr:zinc finger protein 391-like [Chrysoperla carnea]